MNLKSISKSLFGRKPRNYPVPAEPELEAHQISNVPRSVVDQKSGYQSFLLPGRGEMDSQAARHKRHQLLMEMKRMAQDDPRVNRILYKLSSDATENSFSVNVEDAPGQRVRREAQAVIDRCRHLIDDREHLRGWVESLLRDGDLFLQLMVSRDREIVQVKKLAAEMTYSRLNAKGEFPENQKPFYQARGLFDHEILGEFEDWEVVHAKWRSEDGKPYGSPLFLAGRKIVKRVDSGEEDMSIRRKLRAGLRFFFNLGTADQPASWAEVERFKEANKDTLENPVNAVSNFYGNGLMDMKAIQGDTQLGNKEDIDHFEGLITMIGLTPSSLISGGRERATNLNVVDSEDEDYSRTLLSICSASEFGFLRPIFDTQLFLSNINPDSVDYTFNWGAKLRESDYRKLQKAKLWVELGFSHETAYALADPDNGLSYEDELARIEEQVERGAIPYQGPALSRSSSDNLQSEPLTDLDVQQNKEEKNEVL